MQEKRFFGTIETCFYDFVEKHPGLPYLQLIADFCDVDLAKVQRWQRRDYFPGGAEQLTVACLLHLLGYEVEELNRLDASSRGAALLLGLRIVKSPDALRQKLEYHKLQSLWGFLLHGEGGSEKVREKAATLIAEKETSLRRKVNSWNKRIKQLFPDSKVPERTEATLSFTPEMAAAFARSVGTTTALAGILVAAGEGQAARDATGGGNDMHELLTLLQQLTA